MEYDTGIDIRTTAEVYPPSDDSILLIESLAISEGEKVLEVGCGSGVVSLHCAKNGAEVTAVDVNPDAVDCTMENAARNCLDLDVGLSDVYDGVGGCFDTVVFNLPYLPVDEGEGLARAWSGGPDGLGPLPRLLEGAPSHLNPDGRVVVVVSSLMDQDALASLLSPHSVKVLGELPLFFERLSVLEIIPRRA
jgi:release factor glutamine methyltransferase